MSGYDDFSKIMDNVFYKDYVSKINDEKLNNIIKKYEENTIGKDVFLNEIDKYYNEFYTTTLPKSAENLNKSLNKYNVEVYYFPKTN